jgi:hypothetical protein
MGGEIQTKNIIGKRVKLKSYSGWGDYRDHHDEKGIIVNAILGSAFTHRMRWNDGCTSCVHIHNLIIIENDGDN